MISDITAELNAIKTASTNTCDENFGSDHLGTTATVAGSQMLPTNATL